MGGAHCEKIQVGFLFSMNEKKILIGLPLTILCLVQPLPAQPVAKFDEINLPFTGVYRANAKTSIARNGQTAAAMKEYPTLPALIATLKRDSALRVKYPFLKPMHHTASGIRVIEESRNVRVKDCYVLVVKYEKSHIRIAKNGKKTRVGDNDFHLVVGSSPNAAKGQRMNMEVGGLPSASGVEAETLRKVRRDFLAMCARTPSDGKFVRFSPPIHATIEGSLFFDGEHTADQIAPAYHLKTTWEVHPITKLVRLSDQPRDDTAPP